MPLSATSIKNLRPAKKVFRRYDSGGLYIEVPPAGNPRWRFKYRIDGKEKRISLGVYPDVSLADARGKRDDARKLIAKGLDPAQERKVEKRRKAGAESFEVVAREFLDKNRPSWAEGHYDTILRRLERHIFPVIGSRPIGEITSPELLAALRRIEAKGIIETAHRARQVAGQIFRYAIACGYAERDPAADLKGALAPVKEEHFASLTDPDAVRGLLRAIDAYDGQFVTKCALRLAPLVFARPGELRKAEWSEIDLEAAEWRIPGAKMKMGEMHIIPLSRQAVEILREIHALTGPSGYVFPSIRTKSRPMSENTVNAALRRMGFDKGEMTGHGFRSMASTILHEQGWSSKVIERQLAHAERNKVKAAYNYAEHLPERRKMMQAWSDCLDALKSGAKVTPIRQAQ